MDSSLNLPEKNLSSKKLVDNSFEVFDKIIESLGLCSKKAKDFFPKVSFKVNILLIK